MKNPPLAGFFRPACCLRRAPVSRTNLNESESAQPENGGHEEEQVQRSTDHWVPGASVSWLASEGLCRQEGFSEATFYKWRAKYGGLQVSEAVRLHALDLGQCGGPVVERTAAFGFLRFMPALNVTLAEVDLLVEGLGATLDAVGLRGVASVAVSVPS